MCKDNYGLLQKLIIIHWELRPTSWIYVKKNTFITLLSFMNVLKFDFWFLNFKGGMGHFEISMWIRVHHNYQKKIFFQFYKQKCFLYCLLKKTICKSQVHYIPVIDYLTLHIWTTRLRAKTNKNDLIECLYVVFVKRIHKIKVQNIIQTGNLPSFVWTQKNKHNIPVTVLCISHAIQSLFLFIIS